MPATTNVQVIINGKDNASNVIKGVGKSFAGLNQQVTSSLKTIGTFGLIGAAGLGAFAVKTAFSSARVEELGFALNAIAKANNISQKAVDKTVESLRGFNIAQDKALQVTSLFIQSELDLADATKLATVAKDLAVLASVDSSEATKELTRAIVTQRPILLKQFGIQKGLIEIYDDYADSVGKSATELTQAEKKQAFLNTILKEGKKVAGTYEAAMGSVSKRFRSLTGRIIPDFMAKIGKAFQPALTVIVDAIADSIANLSGWIDDNQEKIKEWGKVSAGIAKQVVIAFGEFIRLMINNKEVIVGILLAFGTGMAFIAASFVAANIVVLGVFAAITAAGTIFAKAWGENWFNIREITAAVFDFIVNVAWPPVKGFLIEAAKKVGEFTKFVKDNALALKVLVGVLLTVFLPALVAVAAKAFFTAAGLGAAKLASWALGGAKTLGALARFTAASWTAAAPWVAIAAGVASIVAGVAALTHALPVTRGGRFDIFEQLKALKELSGFQTGGVVPGPVGKPQAVIAHGGEEIRPRASQGLAGGGFNVTVNIGTMIASDSTRRNFAELLLQDLENIAAMKGKNIRLLE